MAGLRKCALMAFILSKQYRGLAAPSGFTNVPDDLPIDGSITGTAASIFVLFCFYDQKYRRQPTNNEILDKLKISKSAFFHAIKQLQSMGFIERVARISQSSYSKIPIPEKLRWEIWERDDFTCKKCGSRRFLTIDHVHPERHGGEAKASNLQTLCKSCNSAKRDSI